MSCVHLLHTRVELRVRRREGGKERESRGWNKWLWREREGVEDIRYVFNTTTHIFHGKDNESCCLTCIDLEGQGSPVFAL